MDTRKMNGNYRGKPVDGGLGETSTGKEQVAVLFDVTEGEFKGARLTYFGYFTEGTTESTIKALRAIGWQGTDLSELLDWKKAIPNPAEVELVIQPEQVVDKDGVPGVDEQGNPMVRARVRWVNPLGRIGIKTALPADKAAAFAARMKGHLVAFDAKGATTKTNGAPPRSTPPKQAVDPGDIPF